MWNLFLENRKRFAKAAVSALKETAGIIFTQFASNLCQAKELSKLATKAKNAHRASDFADADCGAEFQLLYNLRGNAHGFLLYKSVASTLLKFPQHFSDVSYTGPPRND